MTQKTHLHGWHDPQPDAVHPRKAATGDISQIIGLTEGTAIDTPDGPRLIETLTSGEMVTTANGPQPLRRIGAVEVSARDMAKNPKLRPIRIVAGSLGPDTPQNDILVSQQHRMLVSSADAQRMFGESHVLISALRLTILPGVMTDTHVAPVTYIQMLFDAHQIIHANGAATESLLAGSPVMGRLTTAARSEILRLFPALNTQPKPRAPAALIPAQTQQKAWVQSHAKTLVTQR